MLEENIEKKEKRKISYKNPQEMDRIAKMLLKRDFELAEIRQKREEEFKELEKRTKELEASRVALINMLEDIDEERKRAEEEKNKTLAIVTNFSDGLLVFDEENKLSLIDPQAEDFFKVSSKEFFKKSILELSKIPNFSSLTDALGEEIKGIFRKELKIEEDLIVEISSIPMVEGEKKLGTLIILHDITREKTIEKIKTEFVSLAAHQLRTPLSAIKWTIKLMLDGDIGEITGEQRELLEKSYHSNERMINLINDLLNITRIEEGRYLYKPAFADVEPIVQFAIKSVQNEVKQRKLKLKFIKPKQKIPEVKIDVEKIKLAVQNLLENAIRYTKPGGEVTVFLKSLKDKIEFSVKDTGVGIPEEQQKRIFTKFFRGSNVIRLETEGSGLGLFITKNIIEAHGGEIWFKSKEGKGTTFYFSLPTKERFREFLSEF